MSPFFFILVASDGLYSIYVTVGRDKPLARLIVVRRLVVDKGQVLQSGILDTPLSLCVLLLRNSLIQELKIPILSLRSISCYYGMEC